MSGERLSISIEDMAKVSASLVVSYERFGLALAQLERATGLSFKEVSDEVRAELDAAETLSRVRGEQVQP